MDYRVVITINVTEPQLEKCWTQQWWNSVETSRNNLSGELADDTPPSRLVWETATPKHIVSLILGLYQQLSVPQKKSLFHFKGASLSFTNEVDVSFFDRKCQVSSELVNVHLGYLATSQQSEIQTQFPLHQHLLQTNQSTSFQMYLCAHMWYLSYKCFHASTTMWSQLSIINQALFA